MDDSGTEKKSDRVYPTRPILCVAGLIFKGRDILLVKRAKQPGYGQWSIPGGAVKVGESLAGALAREMSEEVGLDLEIGPLVEVFERVITDREKRVVYHYVIMDYLCSPLTDPPRPGSDASEARYVPPEQWPDYGIQEESIEVMRKALNMIPVNPDH